MRACIRLQARDKLLQDATAQSATLKAGDEVVFDSRLLHAGTGNLPVAEGFFLSIFFNRGLAARSWGASKCAIRHVGPAMTVEQRWCDGDYTGCITKREKAESTIGVFLFFARQVDFGAKLSLEETQERATDVGPVKNKEKKRERERERERGEGRIKR